MNIYTLRSNLFNLNQINNALDNQDYGFVASMLKSFFKTFSEDPSKLTSFSSNEKFALNLILANLIKEHEIISQSVHSKLINELFFKIQKSDWDTLTNGILTGSPTDQQRLELLQAIQFCHDEITKIIKEKVSLLPVDTLTQDPVFLQIQSDEI